MTPRGYLILFGILILAGIGGFFVFYERNSEPVVTEPESEEIATTTPGTTTPVKPLPPIVGTSTSLVPSSLVPSQTPTSIPKAHNAMGFSLIKSIKKDEGNKNIFMSPTSIALALSMVYNGARGDTQVAMQKALQFQGLDIKSINEESLGLINMLKNPDPKVELSIANSVWAREGVVFNQSFIDIVKNYFKASSATLDFIKKSAVTTINSWVSTNTKGKIPTILSEIPSDAVMYLINAVYFKGTWTKEFDKKLTVNKTFTTGAGTTKSHPLMSQTATLPYFENDDFQSVALSYGDNKRLSMYVFLPKDGVDDFVTTLTPEKWDAWMVNYKDKKGTVLLPKFKMEYEKQLQSNLEALGMGVAFTDAANLSGIAENLMITAVKHKSYVDVNEEGTEAAAVTSVEVSVTSFNPDNAPFYMEVNKPFFFAIRDNQTREVLFMGIVQNP